MNRIVGILIVGLVGTTVGGKRNVYSPRLGSLKRHLSGHQDALGHIPIQLTQRKIPFVNEKRENILSEDYVLKKTAKAPFTKEKRGGILSEESLLKDVYLPLVKEKRQGIFSKDLVLKNIAAHIPQETFKKSESNIPFEKRQEVILKETLKNLESHIPFAKRQEMILQETFQKAKSNIPFEKRQGIISQETFKKEKAKALFA